MLLRAAAKDGRCYARPMQTETAFICLDCGDHVVRFIEPAANDQHICAACLWLRQVESPEDREMLRALLRHRG